MKIYYKIAAMAFGAVMLTGCADTTIDYLQVDKPASIAEYEYLDNYGPLKSYIDRSAHPNFLVGSGVTVSEYNNKNLQYRVTNSNFDIMTAGNAMKYASIVDDNGDMNFGTVEKFVENAQNAGMQIYGHTLCWHAQQNTKWLNSLIADKEIEVDPDAFDDVIDKKVVYADFTDYPYYPMWDVPQIEGGLLVINNTEPKGANWEGQYFVLDGCTYKKGGDYLLTAKIRGEIPGTLNVIAGDWGGQASAELSFTNEWKEVTVKLNGVPAESGFVSFQSGACPGRLEIEWVCLHHHEAPSIEVEIPLVTGGDAESGPQEWFVSREPGRDDISAPVVEDSKGTGKVFVSKINGSPSTEWDSQFFIRSNTTLNNGDKIHVKFRYRADDTRNIPTQAHGDPGAYHHWEFIGTLNATPEWKDFEFKGTVNDSQAGSDGCRSIAFNLCTAPEASALYIDDIEFYIVKSSNTLPLTPEEKAEVLEAEMARWIEGMMKATGGYVKAWDVVNEAISGGPWGQRYDLQHGTEGNPNDFFWQDYLGDNFVRIPVKYARQYFAENGGNPSDLKLFVNDYNLESDWDDNHKLKSLISWIEQWESDGVTKIDGIGTQMHISYYLNPQTQKSKEDHIVKMFELMAKSGKLCRITELDMGICDESNNPIKTEDVTLEQHKLMSDYYKFIIQKYFEIIPVEQQHGITHWCQTDAPSDSGWRGGEPVGLWNQNYNRKPTYAGFAEGLETK